MMLTMKPYYPVSLKPLTSDASREATIEECAKIADEHKKRPHSKIPFGTSEETRAEIHAEERGENIASEMIAKTIRKLLSPSFDKTGGVK